MLSVCFTIKAFLHCLVKKVRGREREKERGESETRGGREGERKGVGNRKWASYFNVTTSLDFLLQTVHLAHNLVKMFGTSNEII